MMRRQAVQFELMPNGKQARDMRRLAGSCRFVDHKPLAMQKETHEAGNKSVAGPDTPWLKEAPCPPWQHALKDLANACKNFFARRADFPRCKCNATVSQSGGKWFASLQTHRARYQRRLGRVS